jgi:hypothetical protein
MVAGASGKPCFGYVDEVKMGRRVALCDSGCGIWFGWYPHFFRFDGFLPFLTIFSTSGASIRFILLLDNPLTNIPSFPTSPASPTYLIIILLYLPHSHALSHHQNLSPRTIPPNRNHGWQPLLQNRRRHLQRRNLRPGRRQRENPRLPMAWLRIRDRDDLVDCFVV